jgi:hypothetical protein
VRLGFHISESHSSVCFVTTELRLRAYGRGSSKAGGEGIARIYGEDVLSLRLRYQIGDGRSIQVILQLVAPLVMLLYQSSQGPSYLICIVHSLDPELEFRAW